MMARSDTVFMCCSRSLANFIAGCLIASAFIGSGHCQQANTDLVIGTRVQTIRNVVFSTSDSVELKLDIYRPTTKDRLPLVVMIHGGGWFSGDKGNLADHAREIALSGFVAASINYRLAPAYKFPAQLNDCISAIEFLLENEKEFGFDANRMGLWGYSAGAHLSALVAYGDERCFEAPSRADWPRPRCVVLGGTPCDLTLLPEENQLLVPLLGSTRKENPQIYENASPMSYVQESQIPSFFFHGDRDLIVPYDPAKAMHDALLMSNTPSEFMTVKGHGHLFTFLNSAARKSAIEFLREHLLNLQTEPVRASPTTP